MRGRRTAVLVGCLALVPTGGCKRGQAPPPAGLDARPALAPVAVSLPARGVGMDDPFARMNAGSVKALNTGYGALRAKRYDDARAAFATVVAAHPDHTAARFQQIRATALAGRLADVAPLWAELLMRDFVAYRGRLDQAGELAPLRASPEWARLRAIEQAARPAYAAGLAAGAFFVAPTREGAARTMASAAQEAFHFDLTTGRYRRLTDGGQVFALAVTPDRKKLSVLLVAGFGSTPGGKVGFRDPRGLLIDLSTLESLGPASLGPPGFVAAQVTLCPSATGEPLWVVGGGQAPPAAFAFDATGATLARAGAATCAPGAGTEAAPDGVRRLRPEDSRARLSDTGELLQIQGAAAPIRLARPIEPSSLSWSPAGKRLAYAGLPSPCRPGGAAAKNELFLWDADRKRPARIASGASRFDSIWLDDDHLLYEGGVEGGARLYLHDVAAGRAAPLKPRAGAGLVGTPRTDCDEDLEHEGEDTPDGSEDDAE